MSYIYLTLSAFFWGTSFVAGKYAFEVSGPISITFFRFLIASVLFLPIFYKNLKILDKSVLKDFLFLSFLTVPATFLLQFIGLKYTTVSSASIILGLEPFIVILIRFLFWKIKTSFYSSIASFFVFLGVFLTFNDFDKTQILGSLFVLLSTFIVGFWIVWSKNLITKIKPLPYTAFTTVFGTLQTLPFFLLWGEKINFQGPVFNFFWIFYLGIFCTFLAWILWNKGLSILPDSVSGFFLALEPIFGVLFGIILFNEKMNWIQISGILLVIFSILINSILSHLELKKRRL